MPRPQHKDERKLAPCLRVVDTPGKPHLKAPSTIPLPNSGPDYILTVERPGQFLIFMIERADGRPGIRIERG